MHKLIFRPYFFIFFVLVISSCGGGSSQTSSAEAANTAPELVGLIDYAIPENTTFVTTIQASQKSDQWLVNLHQDHLLSML